MDERKRNDLLAVLAAISAAVPDDDPEKAKALVDRDYRAVVFANPRIAVRAGSDRGTRDVCSHSLEIIDGEKIRVGGGGVVIACREAQDESATEHGVEGPAEVRYALKVARPSLFLEYPERQEIEAEKAEQEYRIHLPLAHQNIAKMYNKDEIDARVQGAAMVKLSLPCTLIEWIDDAKPLGDYVRDDKPTPAQFADLLTQACWALDHLHASGMVHWDIKSDNLLVSGKGEVKLMDLGNARPLRDAEDTHKEGEEAESTLGYLPPLLNERSQSQADERSDSDPAVSRNRAPIELKDGERVWDRPWLDLYMLAREANRVGGFDLEKLKEDPAFDEEDCAKTDAFAAEFFTGEEGEFILGYLRPLLDRLLAADSPQATAFYDEAEEVATALSRLLPAYGAGTDIPELQVVPQHVLRVPPAENIPWTGRIHALMSSETLLGLKKHRQLATVRHVYPGAEHTRWEHSIGALGRVLQSIRALYADRHSIIFRLDTSELDLTAIMVATLVHDVGHPAFGHQVEESPLIIEERRHEAYALALLGAARASAPSQDDAKEIRTVLEQHWCQPEFDVDQLLTRTIEVLQGKLEGEPRHEDRRVHLELLHTLLVGPLDADKCDYLTRDAHHCGVEYTTGIDRKRLDQALTALEIVDRSGVEPRTAVLGINRKGVLPLESMLVARYQLFRSVYWHHTVRGITVMLQELIEGYVLPRGKVDATDFRSRLDLLQENFRELPDEQAITWLAGQVEGLVIPPEEKSDLLFLAEGVLGKRVNFPWQGGQLSGTSFDPLRSTYLELRPAWSRGADDTDGSKTVRKRRQIRSRLASELKEEFAAAGFPDLEIREADVLLDVPVEGRDEVKGLFVSGLHGNPPEPVDSVTPLAKAVATAFESAVRPVSVFLRPGVAEGLGSGTSAEAKLSDLIRTALRKTIDDQLQIPDAVELELT